MRWDKLLSGRFIFTIVGAGVFGYMAITSKLPAERTTEILLLIIYAYFSRGDRGNKSSDTEQKEGTK